MPDRTHFSQEREKIDRDLLAMGTRVEEQLGKALRAMRELDTDLAREVKANDEAVDELQIAIEDQVTVMIATQAPVAMDVRELVAALKLADNLERAGDHAVHLAKAVKKFALEPKFRPGRAARAHGPGGRGHGTRRGRRLPREGCRGRQAGSPRWTTPSTTSTRPSSTKC